jgi:UDP-galactopyranose mutase
MHYDWLIVGAGFTGCTLAERLASQLGQTVLVIDKRPHIGGNAYDAQNEDGVLVHRYGPHIFHTNSLRVWEYLSRFTAWRPYEHQVLAVVDDKLVPVPFNLNTLDAVFAESTAARLAQELISEYGFGANVPILRLRENPSPSIRGLADFVYEKIFYGYTLKQWELTPEQLDPLVTGRVPVRLNRDNRYFEDVYQAMPRDGYTHLFQAMLDHPNISVSLDTDFRAAEQSVRFDKIIYTGPIDAYFDYVHGALPYRSLKFDFETIPQEWFQPVGTVNYPNSEAFTRITEQKHITGQIAQKTTLVREYPCAHVPGENEPYYPIPRPDHRELYQRYYEQAKKLPSVWFAGRLADYKYYNMDQAVARALKVFEEICSVDRQPVESVHA